MYLYVRSYDRLSTLFVLQTRAWSFTCLQNPIGRQICTKQRLLPTKTVSSLFQDFQLVVWELSVEELHQVFDRDCERSGRAEPKQRSLDVCQSIVKMSWRLVVMITELLQLVRTVKSELSICFREAVFLQKIRQSGKRQGNETFVSFELSLVQNSNFSLSSLFFGLLRF